MKNNIIDLAPNPSSLIASMRDIGYSFESAIADILDNSISARATWIHIRSLWNNGNPYVAIIDNGCAMTKSELCASMRFGSTNPLSDREAHDMGRFGLGMKTASISQCRLLTVLSKKNEVTWAYAWDLDHLDENPESSCWAVKEYECDIEMPDILMQELYDEFLKDGNQTGTIVLWQKMDRIRQTGNFEKDEKVYQKAISLMREHISLTFHRFIKSLNSKLRTIIYLNNVKLESFDPFNMENTTTMELPEETIPLENKKIIVQPYVLPHHNKVACSEYKKYAGEDGYLSNQGFYIYRNNRLIIKGTWFRLHKREELAKLIRVKVDIPNSLDHIWKIDIKKSNADLPENLKQELRRIISRILDDGKGVYLQRGYRKLSDVNSPIWIRKVINGEIFFLVNRNNILLRSLIDTFSEEEQKMLTNYLRALESNFPRDLLFSDMGTSPESLREETLSDEEINYSFNTFLNYTPDVSIDEILESEPFCRYPVIVRNLFELRRNLT